MYLVRPLCLFLLLAGLTWGMSGCLTAPEYDIVPAIEFNKLDVVRYVPPRPRAPVDTFKIIINFKDGDGDLGLTNKEVQANPTAYNYFLRAFRRVPPNSQFVEVFPGLYFSQFPLLNGGLDTKPSPLKGDLTLRQDFTLGSPLNPGDEVKFTVSIKDRAQNQSNMVETNVYVVPPR